MQLVRQHPLVVFFMIAYATAYAGAVLKEAFDSELWGLLVWGTFLGALFVISVEGGAEARRAWLRRIVQWRFGWQWYAVVLLLPVALRFGALALNLASGAPEPASSDLKAWGEVPFEFIFVFLLIALAEEPAFRGFALPRLMKGRSAISAALILGVLHAGWHAPLFVTGEDSLFVIPIVIAGSVIFAWIYQHTDGSILPAVLLHASVGGIVAYFNDLFEEPYIERQTAFLALMFVVTAAAIVVSFGPDLAGKREKSPAPRLEPLQP
jgi:membrane protease YdiL (CAAX protease family)